MALGSNAGRGEPRNEVRRSSEQRRFDDAAHAARLMVYEAEGSPVLTLEEQCKLAGLDLVETDNALKFYRRGELLLTFWPRMRIYMTGTEKGRCDNEQDALELATDHASWKETQ
jgi:hypothetical protein